MSTTSDDVLAFREAFADDASAGLFDAPETASWNEAFQEGGLIDTIFERMMPNLGANDADNAKSPEPASEIKGAVAAIKNIENFRPETTKLRAGEMTSASDMGAARAQNYIGGKEQAVHEAKGGVAELKKLQAEMGPQGGEGASAKASIGEVASNAAASSIVSRAVGAFNGTAGAIASGMGTLTTINMARSMFKSAVDDSAGYGASSGSEGFSDVASGGRPVMDVMDMYDMEGRIEFGVEASLLDSELGINLSPEAIEGLEADIGQMSEDAALGRSAFENWLDTPMAAAEGMSEAPAQTFTLNEGAMAELMHDNPALDQDQMVQMHTPPSLG